MKNFNHCRTVPVNCCSVAVEESPERLIKNSEYTAEEKDFISLNMSPSATMSIPIILIFCSSYWENSVLLELLLSSSVPDYVHPIQGMDHECEDANFESPWFTSSCSTGVTFLISRSKTTECIILSPIHSIFSQSIFLGYLEEKQLLALIVMKEKEPGHTK